ncbi:hypothetical protein J2X69_001093 [Algoriphagus sp. 4150]|uniref:hypothetical protein n=1 Tax=Algoriphagus sp. 4150 TaxID=2817756 RepID=UPI0028549F67|nr:hypothetical protein [Algoriphagus sp. 4150]MDR7128761.1 hypothetical protein [Algoriphagus sp. 4150]
MKKSKKSPEKIIEAEEWDLSEGMGILPNDIPFTQNIGFASGKTKKAASTSKKSPN